jgi:hypothetical protein
MLRVTIDKQIHYINDARELYPAGFFSDLENRYAAKLLAHSFSHASNWDEWRAIDAFLFHCQLNDLLRRRMDDSVLLSEFLPTTKALCETDDPKRGPSPLETPELFKHIQRLARSFLVDCKWNEPKTEAP